MDSTLIYEPVPVLLIVSQSLLQLPMIHSLCKIFAGLRTKKLRLSVVEVAKRKQAQRYIKKKNSKLL